MRMDYLAKYCGDFQMGLLNSEDFVKHCENTWKEFAHHLKDDDDSEPMKKQGE